MSKVSVYQVKDLKMEYESRQVLNIGKLEIQQSELFVVLGPSGAGKSTLLRLLDLIEEPTGGEIIFQGEKLFYPVSVKKRRKIGMVFQRPEMLKGTVWDNVAYPLRLRKINERDSIEMALKQMDLLKLAQDKASRLSGGEIQRVALARTLVTNPDILLLDEPTANLDPYSVELIERIIKNLHKKGTTTILVTHNVFQARRLAQRVGFIFNGEIVEISKVKKFFDSPSDPRSTAFVRGEMVY